MLLANVLRSRRSAVPASMRVAHSPLALTGTLLLAARGLWIVIASGALVLWLVEVPIYHHAALQLHNTNGMVNLRPAEWRVGLHQLGLSPSSYAAWAIGAICLQTWPMVLIGILIFVRRADEWIALFISLTLVTFGESIMANSIGADLARAHPELSVVVQPYANAPYLALFLIPLLFPDGRFVPRWTRWLVAIAALLFIAQAIAPKTALDFSHWPVWLVGPFNLLAALTILLAPIYRYRRVSDAVQRQQIKWVVFGLITALGVFFALGLAQALVPWFTATPKRAVLFDLITPTVALLGFTFLAISFAVAILRYRLWDIDLILNRTLVYGTLTASVIGLYVLIVGGLGALFQARGNLALSLLATALVAILFHPLHQRLQRGVNRLMYGERDEPYAVLSRLGQQLEGTLAPDAVLPSIVETVAQALKLPYVAIALQRDHELVVAAAIGSPPDDPLRLPLLYQGDTIGQLMIGMRPGESASSTSDRRLLNDLARQAGVAAYAVRLTADLQRSRERLVTAREEERRRLRRDLHDGLGPRMASVTLMADAARNLLAASPSRAEALLTDLKQEAQAATTEIRRVVYELRPPALDELGLVAALREQAAQYRQSGLRVSIEAPDQLPPLPAAVEVAAYRIAQEAMTNVLRHAQAQTCDVRLEIDRDMRIEITDDGRGMNGTRAGVGLTSMRERAEELGGWCVVEPLPAGGTSVRASLPMGAADGF